MQDNPEQPQLQESINEKALADNLEDIAAYTVEKHEFLDDSPLAPQQSEEAREFVLKALWRTVDERRKRRLKLLESCFKQADEILHEVVRGT